MDANISDFAAGTEELHAARERLEEQGRIDAWQSSRIHDLIANTTERIGTVLSQPTCGKCGAGSPDSADLTPARALGWTL